MIRIVLSNEKRQCRATGLVCCGFFLLLPGVNHCFDVIRHVGLVGVLFSKFLEHILGLQQDTTTLNIDGQTRLHIYRVPTGAVLIPDFEKARVQPIRIKSHKYDTWLNTWLHLLNNIPRRSIAKPKERHDYHQKQSVNGSKATESTVIADLVFGVRVRFLERNGVFVCFEESGLSQQERGIQPELLISLKFLPTQYTKRENREKRNHSHNHSRKMSTTIRKPQFHFKLTLCTDTFILIV